MTPPGLSTSPRNSAKILTFPPCQSQTLELGQGKYVVRSATTREEIDTALRLRFSVFNIELGEGLATSFATGKDEDAFDDKSDHVILIDRLLGQVVGTCRLRTYEQAESHSGFYSSARFSLNTLPPNVLKYGVEFGRVCIARSDRNKNSLTLLCRFIMEYAQRHQKRYLFGCCSLNSQDPLEGGQLFEWLHECGHTHSEFKVAPRPGFKCIFYKEIQRREYRILPSPFQTYLRLGAKICGMPAIDRELRTIDFFALLDLDEAHQKNAIGQLSRVV